MFTVFIALGLSFATMSGMIPPTIYIIIMMVLMFFLAAVMGIISFLLNGVMMPLVKSKIGGKIAVLTVTAGKNLKISAGQESEGMALTKDGYYIIPTDSVYMLPNGSRVIITYYKYGLGLHPQFIKAATVLEKNGFKDIASVEKAEENVNKVGGTLEIDLNKEKIMVKPIIEEKKDVQQEETIQRTE
jgi:hypothetical protein